jgi:spermidine synthase
MVELGKKYLDLTKYNVDIKIADAAKLPKGKFDLIFVDLYNGEEFPEKFETENYLQLVRRELTKSGVAIFNRTYYRDRRPKAVKFGNKLKKVFTNVEWYYPEANLMFICSE